MELQASLRAVIGPAGTWLVLIIAWIIWLVVVSTKIIGVFNTAGGKVVGGASKLAHDIGEKFGHSHDEQSFSQEGSHTSEVLGSDGKPIENTNGSHDLDTDDEIPWEVQPEENLTKDENEKKEEKVENDENTSSGNDQITVNRNTEAIIDEKQANNRPFNPDSTPGYEFPLVDYLIPYQSESEVSNDEITFNKSKINETLGNFGIPIKEMTATVGPTVTLYEIVQKEGVSIRRIKGLENDIAQSLKALGIRIIAPIPGKGTIGIEVPNKNREVVSMRSAIQSERFHSFKAELPLVLGRTIQNENYVLKLEKLPHLLVAGATGMGKSVGLNAIIASLLYKKDPSQLKFVLIDPKTVEFTFYSKLENHFLAKMSSEEEAIVTDPKKAVYTLNALCLEMEQRLEKCKKAGTKNIEEYNEKVRHHQVDEVVVMPYIVVIIDEFADLIMTAKEVEGPVMRLAQKARAIGIHLIVATQRPDVRVITGGIKANFPARMAFRVMQMIDSRTILDQPGANQLIGKGDMLISKDGDVTRIQCALIETKEIERIVEHIASQPSPDGHAYYLPDYSGVSDDVTAILGSEDDSHSSSSTKYDPMFADIARDAVTTGKLSVSYIQRNYEVGFNRAGRIMTQLERSGIVGPPLRGEKQREVKFYDLPSLEQKLQEMGIF
ncbi:MAG: DNA translocase FtsK [Alistipes sp.]|nr:DNA translocase FtsK [Candidatus Alistipes equi]